MDIKKKIQESFSPMVKIGVTDVDGILRTKYLHPSKVLAALEGGLSFCNVIFGWDSQDVLYENKVVDPGFSDLTATLDPTTYREIPWENQLPFLLADFSSSTEAAAAGCPRSLLKRVIAKAESMGFTARFGPEYEWFVYQETPTTASAKGQQNLQPFTPGMFGYSGLRTGMNAAYFQDLFKKLGRFGIALEGLHTETGPGVMEAAIGHLPTLAAADAAVLFKQGVKQISYRHGLLASFMAKPSAELPGCGGHLHQSLWKGDENVFFAENQPRGMSKIFRQYIAGQLHLLPRLMALFAPTVNSYKRYVPGSWAATHANWGVDNRTTALRAIPGSAKSCRLESRVPGADANPYLVIAASLAAGLYGIERGLELSEPPVSGSAYEQPRGEALPRDLGAAAGAMSGEGPHREFLGDAFVDHFVSTRLHEWDQFQRSVTDWERRRYLELG